MTCPTCGVGIYVFKCNSCGDIRCDNVMFTGGKGGCGSSKGPFGNHGMGATPNGLCKACKRGKYIKM